MRLIIIISLLILISQGLYSQIHEQSKLSLGLNYNSNVAYRDLRGDDILGIIDMRDDMELPKYGDNLGISFRYRLFRNIDLETGLQFLNRGFKNDDVSLVDQSGELLDIVKVVDKYQYLSVPVGFNISRQFGSIHLFASIGLIGNYFLRHQISIKESESKNKSKTTDIYDNYKDFTYSSYVTFGLSKSITNNLEFNIGPKLQYDLIYIIAAPIKSYLYDYGLKIELIYKL